MPLFVLLPLQSCTYLKPLQPCVLFRLGTRQVDNHVSLHPRILGQRSLLLIILSIFFCFHILIILFVLGFIILLEFTTRILIIRFVNFYLILSFILNYLFLLIFIFILKIFGFLLFCAIVDCKMFKEKLLSLLTDFFFMFFVKIIVFIENINFQFLVKIKKLMESIYLKYIANFLHVNAISYEKSVVSVFIIFHLKIHH